MKFFDSDNRVEKLRHHVASRIAPYHALVLAFSGGLDSTVLLDSLAALRHKGDSAPALRAIHIHHALNCHADNWTAHCAKECRRREVAFTAVHVVVNVTTEGIEAAAREVRYRALAAALKKDEVLLTAQHQDDQAETLLLALKRGSGPSGLAAMAADTSLLGRRLVRPLLDFTREDLKRYAQVCRLQWIEDDSNTNLRFDRNFLRLHIFPLLRQRWPKFSNAVARSAQLCAEQEQLLDELLAVTMDDVIALDGSLHISALIRMSESKRSAVLRRWLANFGVKMPARAKLARLWQEVALSRRDSVAHIKLDSWLVRRFRNRLYIVPVSRLPVLTDSKTTFLWPKENEYITLPAGLGYLYRRPIDARNAVPRKAIVAIVEKGSDLEEQQDVSTSHSLDVDQAVNTNIDLKISHTGSTLTPLAIVRPALSSEEVSVRFGSVSGLLYIVGRRRGRTLKKIWQELNVPPWKRRSTPMLFYNDQLITALGVFVTREGAVRDHHIQWQLFWKLGKQENNSALVITPKGYSQSVIFSEKKS